MGQVRELLRERPWGLRQARLRAEEIGDYGPSLRALVQELFAFAQDPAFIYCHVWRAHDAVLWDNRCMLHCATGYDEERYIRHMQRTTLEGDVPQMAEPE